MTSPNSERFINAFNKLENEMTKKVQSNRYVSYSEMIHRLAKVDKTYRRYRRYLEEFGDLRNAIVHERIDGEVIAEPHLKEVEKIEQIASLFTQPERVFPRFRKKVEFGYVDEKLSAVLVRMKNQKFSKFPIYNREGNFVGILTTDAIAYFVVEHIKDVVCKIPDVYVNEVMKFDEKGRYVRFTSRQSSLIDVVMEFEEALRSGKRLSCIIITEHGELNEKPLGIISVSDLPTIYNEINKDLL